MRAAVLVAACSLVLSTVSAGAATDSVGDVRYDGDFLRSLQLADGAIVSDVRRTQVEPYVANHAAWGLARVSRHTGGTEHVAAAVRWLRWYQAHMDAAGIVHDHVVEDGRPRAIGDEDSVDATSGVFLLALREAYQATAASQRRRMLGDFRPGIRAAVAAIEGLQDVDGLTWAKPDWRVKYLMDNSEAFGGLLAAHELATALGDRSLAQTAARSAGKAQRGLAGLWNPATQAYDWAKHADGFRQPTDWSVLYPDAVEQAWTVAFGIAEPARAQALMARFAEAQPSWDQPTAPATYWDGQRYTHTADFWPIAGLAFQAAGDTTRATQGAARIREGAWQVDRRPPYTAGSQGQLILLMSGGVATPASGGMITELLKQLNLR